MQEKIVEKQGELTQAGDKREYPGVKICKQCNCRFEITDKDIEFYDKISLKINGEKYSIPTPTFCSECRQQRRLSWRNERNLYKRKCDLTSMDIISIFSPDKLYKIYKQNEWWSDKWNSLDYGFEFDFNKTFFEQFKILFTNVPKTQLNTDFNNDENSAYTNYAGSNKNCYLCFDSDFNQDCIFLTASTKNKNCVDCYSTHNSELCYQGVGLDKSYKCIYVNNLIDSSDCYFSENLVGCKHCYLCSNLTNREFFINNKQYSKTEYFEKIEILLKTQKFDFNKFLDYPKKSIISNNSENITGNNIYNCKNVLNSYEIYDSKDCKYCVGLHEVKDCYDLNNFGINGNERIYDSHVIGMGCNNVLFSDNVVGNCSNVFYSNYIYNNSSNIFGCVGLVGKKYCILNKQYKKEEYEILLPKIIKHMKSHEGGREWGEFFSANISPFGYNETVAQEYYPLSKTKALEKGFNRSDYEVPFPKVEKIIPANKLPDDIKNIPDDILNRAIECEITKKPFKIIEQELEFYRKYNLAIPKRHPDQRHLDRMKLRNPRKLFDRKCNKCGVEICTTYSPDREEIVYCEECYNKEIY